MTKKVSSHRRSVVSPLTLQYYPSMQTSRLVGVVPLAAVSRCSKIASLLDHLIGAGEERRRDRQSQRLGSPKIDDQLELSWLFDRKVAHLGASENSVNVVGRTPSEIE